MQEVVAIAYSDDGQWDVEVYKWNTIKDRIGNIIADETAYALQSKEELDEHVEGLKKRYSIRNVEMVDMEKGEKPSFIQSLLPKPSYITYKIAGDQEFLNILENELLLHTGFSIKLSIFREHDYMSLDIAEDNDKEIVHRFRQVIKDSDSDLDDFVLENAFGDGAEYASDQWGPILIHIPYTQK